MTVLAALAVAGPAGAATKTVNIFASGFSPKSITITEGDTVTWTNQRHDANHQVLADEGPVRLADPAPATTATRSRSRRPARTRYKDELHPKLTGTITVKGLPPTRHARRLAADHHVRHEGDAERRRLEPQGRRVGDDLLPAVPAAEPDPARDDPDRRTAAPSASSSRPQILTTYQAPWKGAFSTPATVQVQPSLSLGRNNGWIVHASAVALVRRPLGADPAPERRDRPVGDAGEGAAELEVVGPRRRCTLPKGVNHLRVTMSVNQAGAGYPRRDRPDAHLAPDLT